MGTYRPQQQKKFQFSKKAIEGLPAHDPASPSREAEYSDAGCIGLHLRVGKNGRRFFQHRYKYLGRKLCLSLGEFPAVTVEDARKRVAEHKALLANDKDPATERTKLKGDLTFAEFADQHYLPFAKQHKATWDDDRNQIEKRLKPVLGKLRLSAISPKDVAMLHAKEKERTTACTANHLLATLRRILNLACKWKLLAENPTDGLDKFREGPLRERYLSREELPRFVRALAQEDDTLSKAALLLLLYTGCRRNEVLSLRWDQVRLDEGRLFLPLTKNGRSRTVFLNERALDVLQELCANRDKTDRTKDSEFVFPSRQGTKKGYLYDLRVPLEKACAIAGIENFRTHDLRHTFASMAVSSGADLYAVQRLLGHRDISMTQRYSHLSADDLRSASQGVVALLEQVAA